jgi:hypothetical protein
MEMDLAFKPGDVVQLERFAASGSTRMASKTTEFLHKSRFALPKRRIELRHLKPLVLAGSYWLKWRTGPDAG